jgi:hypothetical protein
MSYDPKTLYRQDGVLLASCFAAGEDEEAELRAAGWGDYPAEAIPSTEPEAPAEAIPSTEPEAPAGGDPGASGGPSL